MEKYNKKDIQKAIDSIDKEIKQKTEDYLTLNPKKRYELEGPNPIVLLKDVYKRIDYLKDKKEVKTLELAVAELQEKAQ